MSNEKNGNPVGPNGGEQASGGATPMSVSLHRYKITKVPPGCTDYTVNDTIDIYVNDPAPATITINDGDACDGTEAELVS